MKDDRLYLIHVLECINKIEGYVTGGRDAFMASPLIQDAVIRNLQTLAESTKRISEQIKAREKGVDWRRIAGFRNVLVHDYLGVDLPFCWGLIEHELPTLKAIIEKLLRGIEKNP